MLPVSDFRKKRISAFSTKYIKTKSGFSPQLGLSPWSALGKVKIKVLVISALLLLALLGIQLVFAANLSVDGQRLARIEKEITSIESQNTNLKAEIAHFSSLVTLSQRAQELGFTADPKIISP